MLKCLVGVDHRLWRMLWNPSSEMFQTPCLRLCDLAEDEIFARKTSIVDKVLNLV